jgi:5-methylcytosine-specific restriction protein A
MRKDDCGLDHLCGVDDAVIRQQKAKARELRKSRWWQQKISRGRCQYCGALVPPKELTMDHIVPLAMGGGSSKGNIAACNNKKKIMMPIEWQHYLESLGPAVEGQ